VNSTNNPVKKAFAIYIPDNFGFSFFNVISKGVRNGDNNCATVDTFRIQVNQSSSIYKDEATVLLVNDSEGIQYLQAYLNNDFDVLNDRLRYRWGRQHKISLGTSILGITKYPYYEPDAIDSAFYYFVEIGESKDGS